MVGIGSYDTATYKGFSFNADVTVHNSSSIPVDGSIMFTVTDSETGDALSGSLRAIVYDNCDFKARISFPTTYASSSLAKLTTSHSPDSRQPTARLCR